jgi:segregation and condensation protein B
MTDQDAKNQESSDVEEIIGTTKPQLEDKEQVGTAVFGEESEDSTETTVSSEDEDLNAEFLAGMSAEEESLSEVSDLNESLEASEEGHSNADSDATDDEAEGAQPYLQEELTVAGKVEAIIFASPKPLRTTEIHDLLAEHGHNIKDVQDALDELVEFYRDRAGGFHLKYIKRMGYQFQTTSAAKALMEKQFASRPRPLSRASLETLAVIAYRQKTTKGGVTRAEVEFIRGVDAGSIFKTLIERNLLTCVGRKEIPGRPMIFGVTDEFLKVFQLGSLNDLPPLESFQTPSDVLQAANDKISQFEAEQEGVNPEEFINDEEYAESLGDGDVNVLSLEADPFAPAPGAEAIQSTVDTEALDQIPADIIADVARDMLSDTSAEEIAAAAEEERSIAVPKSLIDDMTALDRIEEGQIGLVIAEETVVISPESESSEPMNASSVGDESPLQKIESTDQGTDNSLED